MNSLRLLPLLTSLVFAGMASGYNPDESTRVEHARDQTQGAAGISVLGYSMDPMLRKVYVPQMMLPEYRWGGWTYTNYAKYPYTRYVDPEQEGEWFYDLYGNFLAKGWLLYDWHQTQPRQDGSSLLKTLWYSTVFRSLVIGGDARGDYAYTLSVGDRIHTVLTPMTFAKPAFNGARLEFDIESYRGTLLFSRISFPDGIRMGKGGPMELSDNTHLMAGRIVRSLGDFVTVGATCVNAHQSNTLLPFGKGDLWTGSLTDDQKRQPITEIQILLRDDSPEDGEGGAAFFDEEIFITDVEGHMYRGRELKYHPRIEGGLKRTRHLAADGRETILLTYDLTHPSYTGPSVLSIRRIRFELLLGNDYRVETASDRQMDPENHLTFLEVTRARGNVQDYSNLRVVRFDYGLPTANTIVGFTLDVRDVKGFGVQGELNINRSFVQYPNKDRKKHHTSVSNRATAWYINAAYRRYAGLVFLEAFSMDPSYDTEMFLCRRGGAIDYGGEELPRYTFVEDNDDFDRYPDGETWPEGGGELAVFPGYDENGDFISDFNQNDFPKRRNLIPDYEEPFLRYSCDRPEYLFGMDMNNNGWVDRFENDVLPDYPYRKDHRGYNVYGMAYLTPRSRVMLGQLRERLLSARKRSLTTYAILAVDEERAKWGRWRVYQSIRKAADDITDNLFQWVQPRGAFPMKRREDDPLMARNTWISTTFFQWDRRSLEGLNLTHKMKYEVIHQRDDAARVRERGGRPTAHFLGMIERADYTHRIGKALVQPRWKSQLLLERPYVRTKPVRKEMTQTLAFFLEIRHKHRYLGHVLRETGFKTGAELTFFRQFADPPKDPQAGELEQDYTELAWVSQFINTTDHLGYQLVTFLGFLWSVQRYTGEGTRMTGTAFVTVYAGIRELE